MDRIRTIVKSYTEPNKDVIWFNKKDNKYYYFNNGKWRLFSNNKDIDVTNLSFIKDINVNVLQEEDTVNLVNTYTLENNTTKTLSINIKSENGLSISTKNNDIIIDIKEKQLPNIRWARNGRIDLDNCKNINYILVPCREKCPLLFITNKYLKSFAFRRTISEISDFIINNRATKYNKDTETVKQSLLWKELNQTISDEYLDIEQLPLDLDFVKNNGLYIYTKYLLKEHSCNDEKYGSYIYRKKMNIRTFNRKIPNNYAPIPLLAKYKDKHKIDYILTKLKCFYNYDNDLYQQFERAKETYINFCPYIVIRNTFKKDGGIIPIKDNKLLIDKMLKKIINLEFKVVSNPIYTIHFNDKGILQEPLNPYRYVICTGVGDKHPFRNCNEFKNRYKHFDILRYVYNLYTGEKIIEMFNPKKHNVWNHLYHLYQKRHKIYKLKNLGLYLIGTFYHNDDDKFISGDKFIPYENYKKLPKETGWFLKLGNDINNLTLRCVVPSKMRTIIKQQIRYPKSLINHIINEKYEFSFDRYSDNKDRYPQSNRLNRASHKVYLIYLLKV